MTCAEMDGGGRDVLQGYSYHAVFFGQSARYAFVGGYTSGSFGFLRATKLLRDSMFTCAIVCLPSTFGEGQYNLAAYTYGYIQDKDFTAYASNGQVADMKINLIIGVNVSLDVLFKKESIITPTSENMSARVRLFNDQGQMVATWMSSEGVYVDKPGHAIAANGALAPGGSGFVNPTAPLLPIQYARRFTLRPTSLRAERLQLPTSRYNHASRLDGRFAAASTTRKRHYRCLLW